MPETYPLSLPASNIRRVQWRPRHAVAFAESGFTFRSDVHLHDGDGWLGAVELPPMRRETAEAWISWRLRLKGRWGTFLMGDPAARTALGTLAGSPVADSAGSPSVNQAGDDVLYVRGWDLGATIKAGDYLQIGSGATARLYKNLTDLVVDSSGKAEHRIFPTLREAPSDGATIIVSNPVGLFRLAEDEAVWDADEMRIYGLSFGIMEAI